jgi:hypothetical protein
MSEWSSEEYLNGQITKIKELKEKGYTDKQILDTNYFCNEALRACGVPITYLVPKMEGHEMTFQEWETHTSVEHKWEYFNGYPFGSADERDKILLGLLYTAGLKHFLEILPSESMTELIKLVNKLTNTKE